MQRAGARRRIHAAAVGDEAASDGSCTFLRKGKCTIHDAKPIPCSVFPLGRMLFLNDTTQEHDFHYYLEDFDCAAAKDTDVTVQEWLDRFEVEKYDECVKMYGLGSVCSRLMHEAKTLEEQQEMFQTAFFLMYVKYVTDELLLPQLMQNLAFVQSIHPENSFGKTERRKVPERQSLPRRRIGIVSGSLTGRICHSCARFESY